MSRFVYFLFLFSLFLLASSCKKDNQVTYKISGTLKSSYNSLPVSSVSVGLSANSLNGGTFNIDFEPLASTTTNSQGFYEFEIDKKTYNSFKITYSKEGYQPVEFEVNPDDIDLDDGIDLSQYLDPVSSVQVTLRNTGTMNEEDEITFRYTTANFSNCACCTGAPVTFTGAAVDTTLTCSIVGGSQMDYLYTTVIGGSEQTILGGTFVEPFETGVIEIDY